MTPIGHVSEQLATVMQCYYTSCSRELEYELDYTEEVDVSVVNTEVYEEHPSPTLQP